MSKLPVSTKFFETLFDEAEETCFSASPYGTSLSPARAGATTSYYSINPMHTSRKDANVTVYRNILLEFDKGARDAQMAVLQPLITAGLLTAVTWSGGKSYHAIISLEEPPATEHEYRQLVQRIYKKLPEADPTCKNPSRFSRTPGALRDGELQELVYLGERVPKARLEAWLGPASAVPVEHNRHSLAIHPSTRHFLLFGAEPGERNAVLFRAACDLLRHGWTMAEVLEAAEAVLDLSQRELRRTIESAGRTVKSQT